MNNNLRGVCFRPIEECAVADRSRLVNPWALPSVEDAGTERHCITSRNVALAYLAHEARKRSGGARIARWLANVYDLFLGTDPRPKRNKVFHRFQKETEGSNIKS